MKTKLWRIPGKDSVLRSCKPLTKMITTICALGAFCFSAIIAISGPPVSRPLTAPDDEAPETEAAAPEAEANGDDNQLYYYSEGRKIYLNDTGLAIAKLSGGAEAVENYTSAAPVALAPNDPLRNHTTSLRQAGVILLNTENEGPKALTQVNDEFDYVMPIVEVARRNTDGVRDPIAEASKLIMKPEIAATFEENVDVAGYVGDFGLRIKSKYRGGIHVLELAEGPTSYHRIIRAANRLYESGQEDGQVVTALPNFVPVKKAHSVSIEDPRFADQWHLQNSGNRNGKADADVDAPEAWIVTEGDPTVRVAIVDDSVQSDHPDLADNFVNGIYYDSFSGTDPNPSPRTGSQRHGTPCAGVAVGSANDVGIRGVAPRCGLIGVHFWDADIAQTADAFYFCSDPDSDPTTNDGASVISCSWSWNAAFDTVRHAIDDVAEQGRGGLGTVILFAAGNDYGAIRANQAFGSLNSVITVGATNWRDDHSAYSNIGAELDVTAPSNDVDTPAALAIETTDNTDAMPRNPNRSYSGYASGDYTGTGTTGFGGTSSATPLTAGVCALILSVNPNLTATEVRCILEHSTDRIRGAQQPSSYDPTTSHDLYYGYGRINAKKAVHLARQSVDDPSAIWPDHVSKLGARQMAPSTVDISWQNPSDNVSGVLVVRSNTPLSWKPMDGDRFETGDTVGGSGRVVATDLGSMYTDNNGISLPYYTVFTFNEDYKYSWGKTVRTSDPSA